MQMGRRNKMIPKMPFKCPRCGEEIKRWAHLGCHWSEELHCTGVKKCPNPPKTKRALRNALIEIVEKNEEVKKQCV